MSGQGLKVMNNNNNLPVSCKAKMKSVSTEQAKKGFSKVPGYFKAFIMYNRAILSHFYLLV